MLLLSSADFFQNFVFQKILSGTLSEFDPDQDRHSVSSDLGPSCLQRFTAVSRRQKPPLAGKELMKGY